jgi:AraC family transcriptional regulator of adaptative response/methylated-DNA-[protein]-cysteine methyltransferase
MTIGYFLTPQEWQQQNPHCYEGVGRCQWGWVNVSWDATTKRLCHIGFTKERSGVIFLPKTSFESANAQDIVDSIFSDTPPDFVAIGTPFQVGVWQALYDLPWGKTTSYSSLAASAGKPLAVRAVASAVAANPLSWLIPCHRVLPKSGGIGNYRWGSPLKEALLTYEQTRTKTAAPVLRFRPHR